MPTAAGSPTAASRALNERKLTFSTTQSPKGGGAAFGVTRSASAAATNPFTMLSPKEKWRAAATTFASTPKLASHGGGKSPYRAGAVNAPSAPGEHPVTAPYTPQDAIIMRASTASGVRRRVLPVLSPAGSVSSAQPPRRRNSVDIGASSHRAESQRNERTIVGQAQAREMKLRALEEQRDYRLAMAATNGVLVDASMRNRPFTIPGGGRAKGVRVFEEQDGMSSATSATGSCQDKDDSQEPVRKGKRDSFMSDDDEEEEEHQEDTHGTEPEFEGCPSFREAYERQANGQYSKMEMNRARAAFGRFLAVGAADISEEGLHEALVHLGFLTELEGADICEHEISSQIATNAAAADNRLVFDIGSNLGSKQKSLLELTFLEFTDFLEKYSARETGEIRAAFAAHCTGGDEGAPGGETIPLKQLSGLLGSMGIIVLDVVVEELLEIAGLPPSDTSLNFDGLLKVLAAYQCSQGLTKAQRDACKEAFDELAEPVPGFSWEPVNDPRLKASQVKDALVEVFGLDFVEQACELVQGLEVGVQAGVGFHEFLIWARRMNNADLKVLREHFITSDEKGNGHLEPRELDALMKRLGYTLFESARKELFMDTGANEDASLDFDAVVRYMKACREKDGFTQAEIEELSKNFEKFDTEGAGELTSVEVLDLLRHQGYTTKLDEVHQLAKKVDLNGNGTMDVGEYTRLMRMFREVEVSRARKVFAKIAFEGNRQEELIFAKNDSIGTMPQSKLNQAVQALGYQALSDRAQGDAQATMSFEAFMSIVDECRFDTQKKKRKHAGYRDDEIEFIRSDLNSYDSKKRGALEKGELLMMLADYGLTVHTIQGRAKVLGLLDKAREIALEAGAEASEVEPAGSQSMSLWPVVQLLRVFCRDNEGDMATREEDARKASGFSLGETAEFRDVFYQHAKRCSDEVAEASEPVETKGIPMLARRRSMDCDESRRGSSKGRVGNTPQVMAQRRSIVGLGHGSAHLTLAGVRPLLSSLRLELTRAEAKTLENKFYEISGEENHERGLDFPGFLLLMRWMLDSNFAGINKAASTAVQRMQDTRSTAPAAKEAAPEVPGLAETAGGRGHRRGSV
eukprot:TRINITY_DN21640_c0_g1_i1.p1 TRINITY_DN21640_c0_g1~~TRINITY_DN21640_c0_g1_i1.p1  ORF type:complete len:1179 (+),score=231.43 TRINITY_DN21640_c0_g1_i1:278-3538(+)